MTANKASFISELNVSRETLERLEIYEGLLRKWNPKINLVSKNSLQDLWDRHLFDSMQVFRCADACQSWLDVGSGGGLPGIVVAIMAAGEQPDLSVTLIESDQRKCAFLRTAIRELGLNAEVLADRIEKAPRQNADVVSARALADLSSLLEYADRHMARGGYALFPKGVSWEKEVSAAKQRWRFDAVPNKSITQSGAVILKIFGVSRV